MILIGVVVFAALGTCASYLYSKCALRILQEIFYVHSERLASETRQNNDLDDEGFVRVPYVHGMPQNDNDDIFFETSEEEEEDYGKKYVRRSRAYSEFPIIVDEPLLNLTIV